jgi:hypothetical protein
MGRIAQVEVRTSTLDQQAVSMLLVQTEQDVWVLAPNFVARYRVANVKFAMKPSFNAFEALWSVWL